MYFPYLFDKASELLALRAMAGELGKPQKIIPLIEPVRASGGLVRLFHGFKKSSDYAYVITNPHQLTLAEPAALATWIAATGPLFADPSVFRPAFKERAGTTKADIEAFVKANAGRPIGLVVTTGHLPVADIASALGKSDCLVFMTTGADRVALVKRLGAKQVIEVNDRFAAQRINADYSGEEWFSRDHLDYAAVHGYIGFSDYTVLPEKIIDGGGTPGAVAIHLTYEKADLSLWVQHFVSDETDRNVGSAGSKQLEAIDYIVQENVAHPNKFDESPAFKKYLDLGGRRTFTSPGNNKVLEISHHLYVVARRLGL